MSTFIQNVHPYYQDGQAGYLGRLADLYNRGTETARKVRMAQSLLQGPSGLILSVPAALRQLTQDPELLKNIVQQKPFRDNYYVNQYNRMGMQADRDALYAASIFQENDILENTTRRQRFMLAQRHLDQHAEGERLIIRPDLSYQPEEGSTGQAILVVENAAGEKIMVHPGSRVNMTRHALADWVGNLGELSRGLLPFGTNMGVESFVRQKLTGDQIQKMVDHITEKGLLDPASENFASRQIGASKGFDNMTKVTARYVNSLTDEQRQNFVDNYRGNRGYNAMVTPDNYAQARSMADIPTAILRNSGDIGTIAALPAGLVDLAYEKVTGRPSNISIRTVNSPEEMAGRDFIERHMNAPERITHYKVRLREHMTDRLRFEVDKHIQMKQAIREGKTFTQFLRENVNLQRDGTMPEALRGFLVQLWDETSNDMPQFTEKGLNQTLERDMRRFANKNYGARLSDFVEQTRSRLLQKAKSIGTK
jgi:hypothetical protein